jgi:predicted Zn-dependent protease
MPRRKTADIAHTSLTDHRIPRKAADADGTSRRPWSGEVPLVPFHRELIDANDPDLARDLGVALVAVVEENQIASPALGRMALPLLQAAVRRWPDDVAAREALGGALLLLGRTSEALLACEEVLVRSPDRERTLANAAVFAEALGRQDEAMGYWRRALGLNPWSSNYCYRLAKLLAERQRFADAAAECRQLLRRNPHYLDARLHLIYCLARGGNKEQAKPSSRLCSFSGRPIRTGCVDGSRIWCNQLRSVELHGWTVTIAWKWRAARIACVQIQGRRPASVRPPSA